MKDVILRKDHTSISCSQIPVHSLEQKHKIVELGVAIFCIVAGVFFMVVGF